MATRVLVVDSNREFAILIRQSLEDSQRFSVWVANSAGEALTLVGQREFDLCVLDFGLPDSSPQDFLAHLRARFPEIVVVAIPVPSEIDEDELQSLNVNAVLEKPFYLPQLASILTDAMNQSPYFSRLSRSVLKKPVLLSEKHRPSPSRSEPELPAWLSDVDAVRSALSSALGRGDVESCLLVKDRYPLAFVGDLRRSQARELAELIASRFNEEPSGSVARYLEPTSTGEPRLLFAQTLGERAILALVLRSPSSLVSARRQAAIVAQALLGHTPEDLADAFRELDQVGTPPAGPVEGRPADRRLVQAEQPEAAQPELERDRPADSPPIDAQRTVEPPPAQKPADAVPASQLPSGPVEPPAEPSRPSAPVEPPAVPAPVDPRPTPHHLPRPDRAPTPARLDLPGELASPESQTSPPAAVEPAAPPPAAQEDVSILAEDLPDDWVPQVASDLKSNPLIAALIEISEGQIQTADGDTENGPERSAQQVPELPTDWLPRKLRGNLLVSVFEGPYAGGDPPPERPGRLVYHILLVPRFPAHRLVGPLAEPLEDWVREICLAWDWGFESAQVDSQYLLASISLPEEEAPADAVSVLRQELSRRLLEQFEPLRTTLRAGQFWARRHLTASGSPPNPLQIQSFLLNARRTNLPA